jgi:hypothetical protein
MSEKLRLYLSTVSERFLWLSFGIIVGIGATGGAERATNGGFSKGLLIAANITFVVALIIKIVTYVRRPK